MKFLKIDRFNNLKEGFKVASLQNSYCTIIKNEKLCNLCRICPAHVIFHDFNNNLFRDELHFHLNGAVNKQKIKSDSVGSNVRIWNHWPLFWRWKSPHSHRELRPLYRTMLVESTKILDFSNIEQLHTLQIFQCRMFPGKILDRMTTSIILPEVPI